MHDTVVGLNAFAPTSAKVGGREEGLSCIEGLGPEAACRSVSVCGILDVRFWGLVVWPFVRSVQAVGV